MLASVSEARPRALVRPVAVTTARAGGPAGPVAAPSRPVQAAGTSLFDQLVTWLEDLVNGLATFFKSLLAPAPGPAPTPLVPAYPAASSRKVFVQYMPWFTTDAQMKHWSYLGHDPTRLGPDGLPDTATVQHPAIGLYDSRDDAVVGYQLLMMKAAGFDGAVMSWYGSGNAIDQATKVIFDKVQAWRQQYGFDFSLMLMPDGDMFKNLAPAQQSPAIAREFSTILDTYGQSPAYQRVDGKPVVMYFPKPGNPITAGQWQAARAQIGQPFDLVSENPDPAIASAVDGAFGWVTPGQTPQDDGSNYLKWLYPTLGQEDAGKLRVGIVYPGFDDSGVDAWTTTPGNRRLMDRTIGGKSTLDRSWDQLIAYDDAHPQAPIDWVNTATWNDWNEGTEIEPSVEQGDAEVEDAAVRNAEFKGTAPAPALAFQFPTRYLAARRAGYTDAQLSSAIGAFFRGDYAGALAALPAL